MQWWGRHGRMGEGEGRRAGSGGGMGEQGSSSSQQIFTAGVTEGTALRGFL